jgi:hypothetical protein
MDLSVIITKDINKKSQLSRRIDWKNNNHRNKYCMFLTEELDKNDDKLRKKNASASEVEENVTILHKCITNAVEKTIDHFKVKKNKKGKKGKKRHIKRKEWWCDGLGKLRENRASIAQKIVKYSKSFAKALKKSSNKCKKLLRILKRLYATRYHLNKVYKKSIKLRKRLEASEKRKRLIECFLINPETFWKEVTLNTGARVEVDIDLEVLRKSYEENFNSITQTDESKNMETKMDRIINRYSNMLTKKKKKLKVKTSQIVAIMKKLKNRKRGGLNKECNEMYKYATETPLPKIISTLFQI